MTKYSIYLGTALALVFSIQAEATTVNLAAGSGWQAFDVDNFISQSSGLEWIDSNDGSALTFNFTLAGPTLFEVVDGGFGGDKFQILDNGVPIGLTSDPANTYPTSIGLNFDSAWTDPNYSTGSFWLSAGAHSITGVLAVSALDDAGANIDATVGAVRLVPEPASLLLLLTGGGLLAAFKRRNFN